MTMDNPGSLYLNDICQAYFGYVQRSSLVPIVVRFSGVFMCRTIHTKCHTCNDKYVCLFNVQQRNAARTTVHVPSEFNYIALGIIESSTEHQPYVVWLCLHFAIKFSFAFFQERK